MAQDAKILSELQGQSTGLDPFAMARNQAANQTVLASSVIAGGPGDNPIAPTQGGMAPQANADFQGQGQSATLAQSAPMQGGDITMNDKLMQQIGKLNVDAKNIPMSNIGKMVLHGRLQNKFGEDYMKNPDVKKVTDQFDQAMNFYSDQVSDNDHKAVANGERTLAAIRGV